MTFRKCCTWCLIKITKHSVSTSHELYYKDNSLENNYRKNLLFIYLFIFLFLGPNLWHMDVPRLGSIGAAASSLCHSHSDVGSKPHPLPTPQLTVTLYWIPNLLSEARDLTRILRDTSWVLTPLSHNKLQGK